MNALCIVFFMGEQKNRETKKTGKNKPKKPNREKKTD
jgi:hypothetical protein